MTVERPTSGNCQATLGDGSTCGKPFEIKPTGNIPKYCLEHRDQYLRKQLEREARRNESLAKGEPESPAAATDEQELDESAGGISPTGESAPVDGVRVCRASSCSIPLTDDWLNEFCPAHWRILGPEARSELVGSRGDEHLNEVAVLRGLKVINRYEGRAAYQAAE